MTEQELQAIEACCVEYGGFLPGGRAMAVTARDGLALIADVRRLRGIVNALINHPAVSNDVLNDCDIEYVFNPGPEPNVVDRGCGAAVETDTETAGTDTH